VGWRKEEVDEEVKVQEVEVQEVEGPGGGVRRTGRGPKGGSSQAE